MNDIIIHISDLHISDQNNPIGIVNKNTHLITPSVNNNKDFLDIFIDKINELNASKISLIITGDIADKGEEKEFDEAEKIISYLTTGLKINNNDLLIVPGDHDVHRFSIESEIRSNGQILSQEKLNESKFKNFNILYKKFKTNPISNIDLIFDKIIFKNFALIGINSNFTINQNGGKGFLATEKLDYELKAFKKLHPNHEIILCTHHNLQGEYEDTYFGQWDETNRKNLIPVLQRNQIKCIFSGNEHTTNSKYLQGTPIILSDSGTFSVKDSVKIKPSFKVYEVISNNKSLVINNTIYELRPSSGTSGNAIGDWIPITATHLKNKEISPFILKEFEINTDPFTELPDEIPTEVIPNVLVKESIKQTYTNLAVQNGLYKIIKDKKLFHQGHFHWSETSRAHNWIDTARLLEDKEDLYFIKNSIIDVLEKMDLIKNTDLIIGLGYEGNIISSKTSIKYDIPYTYLPYSYRWEDHNDFENKLNFDNSKKNFKQVILITDVVNDGRTIRKLVGKETREKKFFDNVDKIIVVSLFYTGHKEINSNILNFNQLSTEEQKGDENVNNIEYYTIQHLKIEKCPYGENYREECFILKDNLHCVHKFYTEKL